MHENTLQHFRRGQVPPCQCLGAPINSCS